MVGFGIFGKGGLTVWGVARWLVVGEWGGRGLGWSAEGRRHGRVAQRYLISKD